MLQKFAEYACVGNWLTVFLHRSDHPTYTVGIYLLKTIPWEYHLHTGIAETDVQMQVFIH